MKIVSLIIKLHSCKNFSGENFEFKEFIRRNYEIKRAKIILLSLNKLLLSV